MFIWILCGILGATYMAIVMPWLAEESYKDYSMKDLLLISFLALALLVLGVVGLIVILIISIVYFFAESERFKSMSKSDFWNNKPFADKE